MRRAWGLSGVSHVASQASALGNARRQSRGLPARHQSLGLPCLVLMPARREPWDLPGVSPGACRPCDLGAARRWS